jgi:isopentenyl-diphosphate delta-isomerase
MKKNSIQVVLVDKNDKILGLKEKFATHKAPFPLHRAISIVIFNKDKSQMLITKRSSGKPTWPYFWTNAVCSHPHPNETYTTAAKRRLYEELGFRTSLKEVFHFTYSAIMDNKIWGEHELDHVFTGVYEGPVKPNPDEAAGYEWTKIGDLKRDLKINPKKYSPWFKTITRKLGI